MTRSSDSDSSEIAFGETNLVRSRIGTPEKVVAALLITISLVVTTGVIWLGATSPDVSTSSVSEENIGGVGAPIQSVSTHGQGGVIPPVEGVEFTYRIGAVVGGEIPEKLLVFVGGQPPTNTYESGVQYNPREQSIVWVSLHDADRNNDGRINFRAVAVGDDGRVLGESRATFRYEVSG